jgi:hypothetical protein
MRSPSEQIIDKTVYQYVLHRKIQFATKWYYLIIGGKISQNKLLTFENLQ